MRGCTIPVLSSNRFNTGLNISSPSPPAWFEPYFARFEDRKQSKFNLKTIHRDNRIEKSLSLPVISVSNVRSLMPKIGNFKHDMIEREISVALLSEVWEKVNCKKHKSEIEKMLSAEGLKYISTPRTNKRGGGAAIVASLEKFTLDKLDVLVPDKLEIIWGLLRPRIIGPSIKEIIVCAFYSPPKSRKNTKLLDHILVTTQSLLTKYPNAGLVIGGDKNNLNISSILDGVPRIRQIVTQPTYKAKVLDIILTNLHQLYSVPIIVPPVSPDDPLHGGVPSDHRTPLAIPIIGGGANQTKEYSTRVVRPLPDSGIREFGQWVVCEEWSRLTDRLTPTQQVEMFEKMVQDKIDVILPQKTIKFAKNFDKPFITAELKKLDRQKKRQYRKNSESAKYLDLLSQFKTKYEAAAEAYLEKNVRSLKKDDPGKAYATLKRMGAQPGDCSDEGSFTLISHMEDNLTTAESTERIAQHFANISQEYPQLDTQLLPPLVKQIIDTPVNPQDLPSVEDYVISERITKTKKPKSSVPGDIPRRLVQEFGPELALPIGKIYRNIVKTGEWPKSWKVEYGSALQKQTNPVNEDHLRIISLTGFFSKLFEQFVICWLLEYIGDQIDWGQYGGLKGSSISHYLIDFVNFILYNQDLKIPHAVVAAMVDFSKAFNRINHNIIITILSDMGVPGWLLRIIIGFLSNRELILRYKGLTSNRKRLPGGGPQGTRLGLFLFLILINAAGFGVLQKHTGEHINTPMNRRTPIPHIHMKFVDDMTLATAINLKKVLIPNTDPNPPRPLAFHDRTEHVLPNEQCRLQEELNNLKDYADMNQMVINEDKTKVMIFNTGRAYDFMPKLTIQTGSVLEVVETFKLLGVILQSNLKWQGNTDYICKKGYARLWMIRRLKGLGANQTELLDVYEKQVRSVLELAVAVWEPGLTVEERRQIERVQKSAFCIILGNGYHSYENACSILNRKSLSERRLDLCLKFAKKSQLHDKYQYWFSYNPSSAPRQTRYSDNLVTPIYKEIQTRTGRYEDSPIPYLTKLLNANERK